MRVVPTLGGTQADTRRLIRSGRPSISARAAMLPACDLLALVAAVLLAGVGWLGAVYVAAVLVALRASGRHRLRICCRVSDEVPRLAASAVLPLVLLLPLGGSLRKLALLGVVTAGMLVAIRAIVYAGLRAAHRAGRMTEPGLIVGTSGLAVELGELLRLHPDFGLRPAGFVGTGMPDSETSLPILGQLTDISEIVERFNIRRIILCFPTGSDRDLAPILRAQCPRSVQVYMVPPVYELAGAIPAGCMDEVWGIPLLPLRCGGIGASGRAAKRAFDLMAGTVLLIVLAPVLVGLVLVQLASAGRPVTFRQDRVTRHGRIMKIAKLRTMSCADPDSQWTVDTDDCSAVGRWLRSTHLDELPQLINVISGDMSLVGPRPERPYFTSRFAEDIPGYHDRHRAHTGITGWAQVHGLTGDTSIPERVRFDNYYIEHWSLWLDLVILARTISEPLAGALRSIGSGARSPRSRP